MLYLLRLKAFQVPGLVSLKKTILGKNSEKWF
jgi:hypothetical protein